MGEGGGDAYYEIFISTLSSSCTKKHNLIIETLCLQYISSPHIILKIERKQWKFISQTRNLKTMQNIFHSTYCKLERRKNNLLANFFAREGVFNNWT